MGQFVDWFAERDPQTFLQEEKWTLIGMGALVLVLLPVLVILESMITHQSIMGNYPMRIRWMAHRYLLNQSLSFYQDEFAGRVATKVMQTALSVRETVSKIMNLAVYVCVYFISVVALVGDAVSCMVSRLCSYFARHSAEVKAYLSNPS
jgi:ATP-binding cassette subfamily B multidrug efflux pump